jgi:hypothetical protein
MNNNYGYNPGTGTPYGSTNTPYGSSNTDPYGYRGQNQGYNEYNGAAYGVAPQGMQYGYQALSYQAPGAYQTYSYAPQAFAPQAFANSARQNDSSNPRHLYWKDNAPVQEQFKHNGIDISLPVMPPRQRMLLSRLLPA